MSPASQCLTIRYICFFGSIRGCGVPANVTYAGGHELCTEETEEIRKLAWEGDHLAVAFAHGRIDILKVVYEV